ncbi:MAG: NAD(P)/FAD-dependent oxidoreductase [Paracoccaceae bacterium]
MKRYDAIVIGAGHNGLAAAATLARKGKSACVIERSGTIGGMSRNAEIAPGVHAPQIAHLLYNLNPTVARELGLDLKTNSLPTVSLAEDGRHVVIQNDTVTFADGSPHPEAATYASLHIRLVTFARLLGQMSGNPPPSLSGGWTDMATLRELAGLAKLGLGLKRLGKKDLREFLRILLSNACDLILDDFADGPLAGALAADAVRGSFAGPRSPGTVFSLMYRLGNGGEVRLPAGGMGAVADAFAMAARKAGCDIRTGSGVARVLVENDRVTGVELEDGSTIAASAVLSSAGAFQSMKLAGVEHFDAEAVRRLRNLRNKGTAAKVNLVLSGAPEFTGLNREQRAGRLLVSPSATYVERAFNPVKYGEMSKAPVVEAVVPSLTDPNLCTDARHILSAIVHYVPHGQAGGWDDKARARLVKLTIETLERYAPGLGALVTRAEALTPADIEVMTGAPGGHWHHAEMGIDQILTVRPVNGMAQYRFGPGGLYLCGASAHPGGDVMGAAGRNAALQLLKDGGAG